MNRFKDINIEKIINFLGIVFLYFLSRRGGDTKDKIAVLIMFFILLWSIRLKYYDKYILYKKEIVLGFLYLILVSISFFFSDSKGESRFYVYTHATIFSLGFLLICLNYKLNKKYIKYILPILLFTSFPSIIYGLKDIFIHYNTLESYRISGSSYPTIYALEIGIYFIIGIFSLIYYKNKYLKFLLFVYTLVVVILILKTQSRNTFLMLPISLVFISFIKNFKKGLIIFGGFIFFGFLILKNPIQINAINRINSSITSIEKIKKDERYILFKEGIELSKKNIIKGEGFFKYKGRDAVLNPSGEYIHFHNIFIETAVTQGLITLLIYILFLLTLFYKLIRNYFLENDELKKTIKLMAITIFIFSHLYGLAEPIFYFEKIYQLIFVIITLSIIIDVPNVKNQTL